MDRTSWAQETAQQLASWIASRVEQAGLEGAVVGLSGGVDSAVVAGLAQMVFPRTTLGVILPCHSDPDDARLAREVAAVLDIGCVEIPLDQVFDTFCGLLAGGEELILSANGRNAFDAEQHRLAVANIKPRLRMIALYYYANLTRRLVLGTGNETELALGYFTKYGDGGADLLPIGGLVKREVYTLAEYLRVPREIIERPPSAGLWPGQTDEAEIGISYEQLDAYLRGEDVSADVAARIERMRTASEHKRSLAPVAPVH